MIRSSACGGDRLGSLARSGTSRTILLRSCLNSLRSCLNSARRPGSSTVWPWRRSATRSWVWPGVSRQWCSSTTSTGATRRRWSCCRRSPGRRRIARSCSWRPTKATTSCGDILCVACARASRRAAGGAGCGAARARSGRRVGVAEPRAEGGAAARAADLRAYRGQNGCPAGSSITRPSPAAGARPETHRGPAHHLPRPLTLRPGGQHAAPTGSVSSRTGPGCWCRSIRSCRRSTASCGWAGCFRYGNSARQYDKISTFALAWLALVVSS